MWESGDRMNHKTVGARLEKSLWWCEVLRCGLEFEDGLGLYNALWL